MITTVNYLENSKNNTFFINDLGPVDNMISAIICDQKQTNYLLNPEHREKIKNKYSLTERISKNGDKICFCEELSMFSRQQKKL